MSSLFDLTSDLINEVKLATQSEKKLYKLEQIKEIILHRDVTLLPQIIPELFELMLDRSVAVRRFLVRLAGDALQISDVVTPAVLSLFSFLIVEANDKLLENIAEILCQNYDKMSVTIAHMTTKNVYTHQHSNDMQQPDPKDVWYQFRSVCSNLVECISAQRNDKLRCQCIKLCEQMVLFALLQSGGTAVQDPRLRMGSGSGSGKTVQEISMHHAFINRVELEKEAESLLAKMVLWARRGGSQQASFSPMVQCRLGQALSTIATERTSTLKIIVPALNYMLQGGPNKSNFCSQISAIDKQKLSVSVLRLLRVAPKFMTSENEQLQQLKQKISVLDDVVSPTNDSASTVGGSNVVTLLSGVHSSDPRKRKLEQMAAAAAVQAQQKVDSLKQVDEKNGATSGGGNVKFGEYTTNFEEGDEYDDDTNFDEESIRQSAVSAVEARMTASKRTKLDDMLNDLTGTSSGTIPEKKIPETIVLAPPVTATSHIPTVTALTADLGDFPKSSFGNSLRLVSLEDNVQLGSAPSIILQPIPPPLEVYSDLALSNLSKLINQAILVKKIDKKISHVCLLSSQLELKLILRMILSMSSRDLDQQRAFIQLSKTNALQSTMTRPSIQHISLLKSRVQHEGLVSPEIVPKDVILPRTLWLMTSHSLIAQEQFHTLLVEGLSISAPANAVRHQATEIIREANTIGGNSKQNLCPFGQQFDHVDLVVLLLKELYIRKVATGEGALLGVPSELVQLELKANENKMLTELTVAEHESRKDLEIYDALCLVVVSRTMQRLMLRPCTARILHSLPRIPVECIRLLELLLLTGTKASTNPGMASPNRHGGTVDRGTRVAALDLMGSLLFSSSTMKDPELFYHTLCPILWLSVHDDFTTRTSAVNCLVGAFKRMERDYQPGEGLYHVRSTILLFALHAAIHCTCSSGSYATLVKKKGNFDEAKELQRKSMVGKTKEDCMPELLYFVRNCTLLENGGDFNKENTDDDQSMEVDCQDVFYDINEVFASVNFDGGALFGGKFADRIGDCVQDDIFIKRHLHLISQLCMNKHTLLSVFFNIYEVTLFDLSPEQNEMQLSKTYLCQLRHMIEKEVLSIIPLLVPVRRSYARQKRHTVPSVTPLEIVSYLVENCNITVTLPLFCLVLDKVMEPISMPASEGLVQLGRLFYEKLPPGPINICVLLPLLGGMTTSEVVEILPTVIRDISSPSFHPLATTIVDRCSEGSDSSEDVSKKKEEELVLRNTYMKKAFRRITHTRPPPLSRARLLIALHQIDLEKNGLKLKSLKDAIGLCISDKDEFTPEIMKEAILTLLEDEIPALALMRTVLLSAQTMPSMQKFALQEVIPRLVRKKTWSVAPDVWEGVLMCVKMFEGQRDFDATIRAFVGLPMTQLKSVITIAKDVKGILNRTLRAMPTADIEECVSGRWAGIEDVNIAQSVKDKEEKENFIKSILEK